MKCGGVDYTDSVFSVSLKRIGLAGKTLCKTFERINELAFMDK